MGLCIALAFYLAGLPVGLTLSLLVVLQGALGKRTWLTRWILHDMGQEEAREPRPGWTTLEAATPGEWS